jgi:putative membrane protein
MDKRIPEEHAELLAKEMKNSPYTKFENSDLILRDELAIDRTLLANERTLLAYLRSAVTLLIAGVSIVHFSTEGWFWAVGLACLPAGLITGIIGVSRYRRMNKLISLLRSQLNIHAKKAGKKPNPKLRTEDPP